MADTDGMDIDDLLKIIHPVPEHQAGDCDHIEWMAEDLAHCGGHGEWKCMLQPDVSGDLLYGGGTENEDYKPCNCSNYNMCEVYQKHHKK